MDIWAALSLPCLFLAIEFTSITKTIIFVYLLLHSATTSFVSTSMNPRISLMIFEWLARSLWSHIIARSDLFIFLSTRVQCLSRGLANHRWTHCGPIFALVSNPPQVLVYSGATLGFRCNRAAIVFIFRVPFYCRIYWITSRACASPSLIWISSHTKTTSWALIYLFAAFQ